MKSTAKIVFGLIMTALLGACVAPKPAAISDITFATIAAAEQQAQPDRNLYFIPQPPSSMDGQRTVEDVLQAYGPYATLKLASYFAKANVSYPPEKVAFIALKREKNWSYGPETAANFDLFATMTFKPQVALQALSYFKATSKCRRVFTVSRG